MRALSVVYKTRQSGEMNLESLDYIVPRYGGVVSFSETGPLSVAEAFFPLSLPFLVTSLVLCTIPDYFKFDHCFFKDNYCLFALAVLKSESRTESESVGNPRQASGSGPH